MKKKKKKHNKNHKKNRLHKKQIHKKVKNSTSKKVKQKTKQNNDKKILKTDSAYSNNERHITKEFLKEEAKTKTAVMLLEKPKEIQEKKELETPKTENKNVKNKENEETYKDKNIGREEQIKKENNNLQNDGWKKVERNEKFKLEKKQRKEEKIQAKIDKKIKKEEKRKKHKVLRFLMKFFLVFLILLLLLALAGIWAFAGLLLGWFGTSNIDIHQEDLAIKVSNSVIVDKNGNILADLSGDEKRKIITLEEMADDLPKAYIAIEDERFYEHSGVDFKRTAGAIVNTLLKGESAYGGSTITQQLVKNITNDNESTGMEGIKRKIREWQRAYQVERMISKEEILELYLNILFVGGNNLHGVELGAEYYFNKSAKDLDLAECAFMAGINHSPNSYNPYITTVDNSEKIKNRTITVLNKMLELEYIKKEVYDEAISKVQNGLPFSTGNVNQGATYSYHTDAVISQVVEQVMEEKGLTEQMARNYVYSSGLTIYSTVDMNIQTRLEEEYAKTNYMKKGNRKNADGTLLNEHTQSGMAIMDYKTGNVVAVAGGLGEKTEAGWNRATQMKKQTGSSIKPLAVVAPGLQEKIITPATIYDDSQTRFGKKYEPENYNGFKGPINIRNFIKTSQNIPAVKIMTELTPETAIKYLQKMGITSLNPSTDNVLSLALGGMTSGVSPLEMAGAYATIANDGIYITPTFYTNIVDATGNTVLKPKQETREVLSKQNAYIVKSIMQEPIKSGGTATYCAIPGIDVAAKTGTTDNTYDRWLCGFTPYYVAATWYGYDNSETVYFNGNPAGQIWDAVMTHIHKNLPSATFIRPDGIIEATVCKVTGNLATSKCTDTYKEIFTQDNMPEECKGHTRQKICTMSGKIANKNCPKVKQGSYATVIPKETLGLWTPLNRNYDKSVVTEICTVH